MINSTDTIEKGIKARVFHHDSRKEDGKLVVALTDEFDELLHSKKEGCSDITDIVGHALLEQLEKEDMTDISNDHIVNMMQIIKRCDFLDRQRTLDNCFN